MKSFTNIKDIFEYAEDRNQSLTLTTLDYQKGCEILHSDGSKFFLTNVKIEKVKFKYKFLAFKNIKKKGIEKTASETCYIIYSEHHTPMTYVASDLIKAPRIVLRNKNGKFPTK